ncbi:hypothetical protein AVEN_26293-1 [Araneus ventricosus]|uniref:Uncharacterized protein n=1 Tax=Araneus ventricosus TaxID=182803 RepID=A0A4Y2APE1_ARAVE|nr:hypothetical protein AVEN_26293-1 [Araneus ventricosus]
MTISDSSTNRIPLKKLKVLSTQSFVSQTDLHEIRGRDMVQDRLSSCLDRQWRSLEHLPSTYLSKRSKCPTGLFIWIRSNRPLLIYGLKGFSFAHFRVDFCMRDGILLA